MSIRDNVSTQIIRESFIAAEGHVATAARMISQETEVKVSSQLLRYWLTGPEFTDLLDRLENGDLAIAARRAHVNTLKASRNNRKVVDAVIAREDFQGELLDVMAGLKLTKAPKTKIPTKSVSKRKMIAELILSDVHYGVESESTNADIIDARLREISTAFIQKATQHMSTFGNDMELRVLIIGDLIEGNIDKGTRGEFGLPQQIVRAIQGLHNQVIAPLAGTGLDVVVHTCAGNHDNTARGGMHYDAPGVETDSHIITESLALAAGPFKNVTFHNHSTLWFTYDVFGHTAMASHGTEIKNTAVSIESFANKVSQLSGKLVKFTAAGHWHVGSTFAGGRHIINGCLVSDNTGATYSAAKGYESYVGQYARFFIEREDPSRSPLYDTFAINVQHVS